MTRLPDNVSRIGGFGRERVRYIVYDATGYAFRASHTSPELWHAFPSHAGRDSDPRYITADTLTALASKVGASHIAA